jgi:hypothetical protein
MRRPLALGALLLSMWCVAAPDAHAGQIDLTVFLGRAYPVYDERLVIRPSSPSLPGVDIDVSGDPLIRTDGGLVLGAALAFEFGILGIEGRIDGTEIGFDVSGARYDLRATQPPFTGLTGSIAIGDGRFDADRFYLLSGNVRLRTPGPIGLVVSGGVSFLPDVTISGSVPLTVRIDGLPVLPGIEPQLRLRVAPGESEHRVGINGGAGLRLGGGALALMAEVRAFYFRAYDLRFDAAGAPDFVARFVESTDVVSFRPVIVNAQMGLVIKF